MYKLRSGVELPKEFKIKVNPEQSKALQKHLFSLGIFWAMDKSEVKYTEYPFLCVGGLQNNRITFSYKDDKIYFENKNMLQIKFKDYFIKESESITVKLSDFEETSFPEKWCIKVTEDNYEELKEWVHKNSVNYRLFQNGWFLNKKISIGKTLFSHSNHAWNEGIKDVFYELITTEQFRKQFGIQKINDIEIKAMESNIYFWHERANYYKKRCKDLRLERYNLSKELETYKSVIRKIESNLKNMFIPF